MRVLGLASSQLTSGAVFGAARKGVRVTSSAERRAHARRLFEESDAEPSLIAGALGIELRTLEGLAAREDWRRRGTHEDGLARTIDRLMVQLSAQLRRFETEADGADGLSKPQLDALMAITRTFDRLSEMKRAEEERAAERPDDREVRRAREVIERRVGELSEQRVETIIDHLERRD